MRQVENNEALTTVDLTNLDKVIKVTGDLGHFKVRARPRPRSADRARSRAHRAEPSLPLSWCVITRASGDW